MNKTSPTEAGLSREKSGSTKPESDLVDALNQVFSLFRINFHNQYYKAFSDATLLNQTKKLWLNSVKRHSADTVLKAAKNLMEQQEYLPTLNQMLVACESVFDDGNLPDVHSAYLEACRAPSPKASFNWSHPLVYHAGLASDWFFLGSTAETIAFPVYRRHFERLKKEMLTGKQFQLPQPPQDAPELVHKPVSAKEARKQAQSILKSLEN